MVIIGNLDRLCARRASKDTAAASRLTISDSDGAPASAWSASSNAATMVARMLANTGSD